MITFAGEISAPNVPQPLADADRIGASAPVQCGQMACEHGDLSSGLWSSDCGRFNWTYYVDETIHIQEGVAHIREHRSHEWHTVFKGCAVHFPAGSVAEWRVVVPIQKIFFIRKPGFVRTMLARLRIKWIRLMGPLSQQEWDAAEWDHR